MANSNFSEAYGKYPVGDPTADYGNPPPMGSTFLAGMLGIPPPPAQDPPMRNYRNRALTQPFRLRERIKMGKPLFMTGSLLGEPETAKIMAQCGADCIFLDWEHTPMGIREVVNLIKVIQTAAEGNCAVVVRVPNFEHHNIAWILDAGASGIIIPHTETVEQVKKVFDAARFPTHGGKRSFPPAASTWGYNDGVPDGQMVFDMYAQAAIILQIESDLGAKNAAELAALPGVDCLMVGSGDLRMDMGLPASLDGAEKSYNENLRLISKAALDNKLGLWCFTAGPDSVRKRAEMGYTGFMVGAENFMLAIAARHALTGAVQAAREWEKAGAKVDLYGSNWGEAAEAEGANANGQTNGH